MVCTWVTGEPVVPDGFGAEGAQLLGDFVNALQSLDTDHGPVIEPGQRAGPVGPYNCVAQAALKAVLDLAAAGRIEPTLIDENAAIDVWEAAVEAPAWPGPDIWVHRDLMGANLLAMNGRLTGVIDFGGLAVGDPAGNVMGAFHVVQAEHRPTFRAVVAADDATWARARGWALTQGLEALPYYLDTHPGMVAMARHVISSALAG
jgi:aminoglycoside phosphotransferase (APT) family kinase protein